MALEKVLRPLASTLVRKVGERASVGKPFYSPIDQAIANITQGTGTGQQMLAELLKTKGVAKELKDRPAIKKALEASKDTKVTKADVERVAAENPTPQVQHRESDTTEYEQWQMPGGENRRNILLRLPNPAAERNAQIAAQIRDLYQGIGWSNQHMAKFPHLSVDEIPRIAHSEQEIARLRKELAALPRTPDMYEGGHFDEKNILAHARVADYYDNNGKKILLIDEIQSDWHQAARDARKNEIKRLMKAEGIDKATANARVPKEFGYAMPETQRLKGVAQPDDQGGYKVVWEDGTFSGGYSKEGAEAKALEGKSNATSGVVPDAPFKQNWHELVMKRLLDDAARNGYDKVVITPGAEQAKRYDLSKQVDQLMYKKNSDGTYQLSAQARGQGHMIGDALDEAELERHVGKDVAQKIINNEGARVEVQGQYNPESMTSSKDYMNSLSGVDLQVGGEGMTGFYDQIIPSFLNDYGKKYGVTVGTHDLVVPRKNPLRRIQDAVNEGHITAEEVSAMNQPQRNAFMDQFQTRVNPVHSFDITPQMREEITTKGQPLYQVAPPVAIGAGAAMQEEEPTEYAGGGIIKKAGQIIGKAAQSSGMAPPVTATKNLTTMQDFHTSLGDRIRQGVGEKQNLIESMPFKYDKGQRVFTEDSARKNRLPYEILDRTLYGNQPMRADHPVLGPGMGAVIKDPDTGKSMRTPYEAGYRVRSEGPEGWQEYVLPETAIKGDVEMAGGGAVRKALKAVLPKGQQDILSAAESAANLDRFLAESAVKNRAYHGTQADFNEFKSGPRNRLVKGMWFTSNPESANFWAGNTEGSNVMPVHLSLKNPAGREEYDSMLNSLPDDKKRTSSQRASQLKKLGHDGLIVNEGTDNETYIAFNSNQIKSAIGNRGTYDIEEADITKAKGGAVRKVAKALLPKGQQDILPAAESSANLDRFLSKSQTANPVFHVAKTDVKQFSPQHRTELSSMGHHFGTSDQANFRSGQYDFNSQSPNIGKYHLSIQNPLEVSHMASFAPDHLADTMMELNLLKPEKYDALVGKHDYNPLKIGDDLVKILKKNGYDGLKYPNEREGEGFSYVPFDATQIKSAIGNRGTYDPAEADINKAKGGQVSKDAMWIALQNKQLRKKHGN